MLLPKIYQKQIGFFSVDSYIARTDPVDVARVEAKTWMCTDDKYETVPHVAENVKGILGQWKSREEADECLKYFEGCMAGTCYV